MFDTIILKANFAKYKSKKTVYFPNGTNTNFFKPLDRSVCKKELGLSEESIYILFMDSYVGRPYKRYDRYKAVIQILREDYDLRNVEELVLTNTPRELVPKYLNSSDMHLLTSDTEGSPNSIKESLACNIPVVSTPVGNANEIIGNIKGCYISKSFDPEELASLCYRVLSNREFNGRKHFLSKKLGIDQVANELLDLYNVCLNK